jgi:ribokinase
VLTPNETEAEILTGIAVAGRPAAEKAARRLLRLGVKNVVLTLGARGALIANAEGICLVPAFKVKPVDTTAAGDVFNGALAVALTEGRPLREAVRFANAAAAISVTRPGAQPSAPARREIERLMG